MIKTERLTVRRVKKTDWRAIRDIWADAATSPYARYDRPNDLDEQAVRKRIEIWTFYEDGDEHMFYAVCLKGVVIGYIAFNIRQIGYEIGYCFHSAYHGNGYAKESIKALINDMKSRPITRLTARTALENTPSVNLLKSLGFKFSESEKVSFYKDVDGNDIVFDGGIFTLDL